MESMTGGEGGGRESGGWWVVGGGKLGARQVRGERVFELKPSIVRGGVERRLRGYEPVVSYEWG